MKLDVHHGKSRYHIEFEEEVAGKARVSDVQSRLTKESGLAERQQKLIYKGRVLLTHQTLSEAKVLNGAKLLLLASGGPTLGQAEAEKLAKEKLEAQRQKQERKRQQAERDAQRQLMQNAKAERDPLQERAARWAKTGIIALRDAGLLEIPAAVWEVGSEARVADFEGNLLRALPPQMSGLRSLRKLRLSRNELGPTGVPPDVLAALEQLKVLAISHARLTSVPDDIFSLPLLEALDLSHNGIAALGDGIARLTALVRLDLSHNALPALPDALGGCARLAELDASHNALEAVPGGLARLGALRRLDLDSNRLRTFPAEILRGCSSLQTLSLHRNPVAIEQLREMPEFREFDERRRDKYTKQMDLRLMAPGKGFDEGLDYEFP